MQPERVFHWSEHQSAADPVKKIADHARAVLSIVVFPRIVEAIRVRVISVDDPRRRKRLAEAIGTAAEATGLAHGLHKRSEPDCLFHKYVDH